MRIRIKNCIRDKDIAFSRFLLFALFFRAPVEKIPYLSPETAIFLLVTVEIVFIKESLYFIKDRPEAWVLYPSEFESIA